MPGRVLLTSLVLLAAAPADAASISVGPFRDVLRTAAADLRACARAHHLPRGRYLVRVDVDGTGTATGVVVRDAPADVSRAAESCIEGSFTRLRYPIVGPTPSEREPLWPEDDRDPSDAHGTRVRISWPFVLAR